MNKLRKIFDHKMWLYDFARITGAISSIVFLRMKRLYLNGKRPKGIFRGKYIVCPNHNSYIDPLKVLRAIPTRRVTFLAIKNLFQKKFSNWLFKRFGCIKVDGTNVDSFKEAINTLDRGHIVTVFPEASVAKGNVDVRSYKSGAAMLAFLADAQLLPIYIGNRKKLRYREVCVIGNKINYKDYISNSFPTMDELDKITQVLREQEIELKKIYDAYIEKKYNKPKREKR